MNKDYVETPLYFYILIRSWNCFEYLDRCIDSVFEQKYKGYKILFVDDASDYTRKQKRHLKSRLKDHVAIFNKTRKYSIENGYNLIHKYATRESSVVIILDGDDWLIGRGALNYISMLYSRKRQFPLIIYGESVIWDGKKYLKGPSHRFIPFSNTPYPKAVIIKRSFRREPFRVSHPMSFKTFLFKRVKIEDFKDEDGKWLRYSLDLAAFLPMLEMAGNRIKVVKKPMYAYNIGSPNINVKRNPFDFVREDLIIRKRRQYGPIE